MDDAQRTLTHDVATAVGYLPHLVGAVIVLLVGGFIAWLLDRIATIMLARSGLDALGGRTGLIDDLSKIGIRQSPSLLLGRMIFFIALLAVVNQVVDILEFAPLSQALHNLLDFMPHVILAAFLILIGVVVADMLSRGAAGAMSRAGVLYHGAAGSLLRTTIIAVSVLMALQQLTIESRFFLYIFLVIIGGLALAFGIAGGWGARLLAENLIAGRYVEREFAIGEFVRVEGIAGKIERFTAASVIVRTEDDRRLTVPNSILTRSIVESKPAM